MKAVLCRQSCTFYNLQSRKSFFLLYPALLCLRNQSLKMKIYTRSICFHRLFEQEPQSSVHELLVFQWQCLQTLLPNYKTIHLVGKNLAWAFLVEACFPGAKRLICAFAQLPISHSPPNPTAAVMQLPVVMKKTWRVLKWITFRFILNKHPWWWGTTSLILKRGDGLSMANKVSGNSKPSLVTQI